MNLTAAIVQELDTDVRQDPDAWKDRVWVTALCFGGVMTVGWCGILTFSARWLVTQML